MARRNSAKQEDFAPRDRVIALYLSLAVRDKYFGYLIARNTFIKRLSLSAVTFLTISAAVFPILKRYDSIIFVLIVFFSMLGYWASSYDFLTSVKSLIRTMMEDFFSEAKTDIEKITWDEFDNIVREKRLLWKYDSSSPDLPLLEMMAEHEMRKLTEYQYREICRTEEYKGKLEVCFIIRLLALFLPFSTKADKMLDTMNQIVDGIIMRKYDNQSRKNKK